MRTNWMAGRSRNKLVLLYTPNISWVTTHYGYLTIIIKLGTRQHLLLWRQSHAISLIPYMEMYCSGLYCASEPLLISRIYATCTSLRWKLNFILLYVSLTLPYLKCYIAELPTRMRVILGHGLWVCQNEALMSPTRNRSFVYNLVIQSKYAMK